MPKAKKNRQGQEVMGDIVKIDDRASELRDIVDAIESGEIENAVIVYEPASDDEEEPMLGLHSIGVRPIFHIQGMLYNAMRQLSELRYDAAEELS